MEILLVAATAFEIQPTINYLMSRKAGAAGRLVSPLITGVGSIATTWALTRRLDQAKPGLVIQAGIAGCFTGRKPGEVLVVSEELLADLGVWEGEGFRTVFDMHLADPDSFPFTAGRLLNPYHTLLGLTGLEPVRGVTVNEISTDTRRISYCQQNISAVVESMEGAPLHYACLRAGVPFLQIRAVSNAVGVRDKAHWDIPLAIARLNEELVSVLEKLEQKYKDHEIFAGIQPLPE